MDTSEQLLFGILELQEAKRLKAALAEKNVALTLVNNPETCGSGKCAMVEVYLSDQDLPVLKEFLIQEKARLLDGLEAPFGFESEVFDPEKEHARCPACGVEFSTTLSECPECGLGFSSEG